MATVPVIDLGAGDEQQVAQALRHACEHVGFLYVSGHGVPGDLWEDEFRLNRALFALPIEDKRALMAGPVGKISRTQATYVGRAPFFARGCVLNSRATRRRCRTSQLHFIAYLAAVYVIERVDSDSGRSDSELSEGEVKR